MAYVEILPKPIINGSQKNYVKWIRNPKRTKRKKRPDNEGVKSAENNKEEA